MKLWKVLKNKFPAEREKTIRNIRDRAKAEQKDKEQELKYQGIQASKGKKLCFGAKVKTAQEVMPKSRW